jgi:hypothetical protein
MYGSSGQADWMVDVYVGGRLAAAGVWAEGGRLDPHTPLPLLKGVGVGDQVELRRGKRVVRRMRVVGLTGGPRDDGRHQVTVVMQ